jgi:hypothetical protein
MEEGMTIKWKHEFDQALGEARSAQRPLLLDFNAAPM